MTFNTFCCEDLVWGELGAGSQEGLSCTVAGETILRSLRGAHVMFVYYGNLSPMQRECRTRKEPFSRHTKRPQSFCTMVHVPGSERCCPSLSLHYQDRRKYGDFVALTVHGELSPSTQHLFSWWVIPLSAANVTHHKALVLVPTLTHHRHMQSQAKHMREKPRLQEVK